MREIRLYGSEGGVPRKRGIPTPIRKRRKRPVFNNGGTTSVSSAGVMQKARLIMIAFFCILSPVHSEIGGRNV